MSDMHVMIEAQIQKNKATAMFCLVQLTCGI